jgi:catechol 2,3-dioxygenase-like lactoylglutathione lyase family enzyme
MIKGMHGMMYTTDADATRAFFRDVLGWKGTDTGDGWLILDAPEADLGFHPSDAPGYHLSFYTDDIHATVREMEAKGVAFTKAVEDHGYGLVACFTAPGGLEIELYQPHYTKTP